MEIKEIKVEAVDEKTGFVLKRIITNNGEYSNRKLAVPNTIYVCEKKRVILGKPLINALFQTHHLKWNKSDEEWELTGLKKAKKHAEKNNRFFIPFNQRNQSQWGNLKWKESFEDFQDLLRKTDIVPFCIPPTASLEEWEGYKEEALSNLSEKQILMPVVSSKHDIRHFPKIIQYELKSSFFLGISCFEMTGAIELMNLNFVKSLNSKLKVDESCALITYFNYSRVMSRHLQIAGSFAFACFGGDIFSQRANFYMDFEKLDSLTPADIYCYDNREKKFTKSNSQKQRYGFDVVNQLVNNVPVSEGLDFQQAIKFLSHKLQQDDLDLINKFLIQKQPLEVKLKDYTGWNVFLDTLVNKSE